MRDDYQPHVWRTADFGKTWTEIGQGRRPTAGSLTLYESPRNAKVLFVGNVIGSYVTWMAAAAGCGSARPANVPVEQIAMSYAQRDLGRGDARTRAVGAAGRAARGAGRLDAG